MITVLLSEEPLNEGKAEASVATARAGAVVVFRGVVRDHDHARSVTRIEYVGHPSAAEVLAEVADRVCSPFLGAGEVERVYCAHRIGHLPVGELAFLVVVAAAHRAPAFRLAAELVDEVKGNLPVWKRQEFADGSDEWVDCP
jgi:molybdopterin synthase catalytic subunit